MLGPHILEDSEFIKKVIFSLGASFVVTIGLWKLRGYFKDTKCETRNDTTPIAKEKVWLNFLVTVPHQVCHISIL